MSKLYPLAVILGLGLSACTTMQGGTTPTAYDGTYTGTKTTLSAGTGPAAGNCPTHGAPPTAGQFVVQNGRVVWQMADGTHYAPIMQNGSFDAVDGSGPMLSGKITNTAMVARVNGGACHTVYDLKRAG
jgi:hypothetical protein